MRTIQWAPCLRSIARNVKNLPRVDRSMKYSRLPIGTVKHSEIFRSRGISFPLREVGPSINLHNNDEAYHSLPIPLLGRESLVRSIALNDVTIILGETGSGKTTRTSQCPLSLGDSAHDK